MSKIKLKIFLINMFCLLGCSEILDIFPPDIVISRPSLAQIVSNNIPIELSIDDNYNVDQVNIYTVTKYGDQHKELTISNENYINTSIPIWTRSIESVKVKAWDENGNFSENDVKVRQSKLYDMDFEDDDDFDPWTFVGAYLTVDDMYHGQQSALFYSENGRIFISKTCREGTISFAYRRGSGCYWNQPGARFYIDGKKAWELDSGAGFSDDSWIRVDLSVSSGYHNFRWEFDHVCSNYDFLLLDAVHLP